MAKLYKVCLDIEGNDRGLTITTVAADNKKEAIEKAKSHVGVMNQNDKSQGKLTSKAVKRLAKKGAIQGRASRGIGLNKGPTSL